MTDFFSLLAQATRQFGDGGGFTRALQSGHQHDYRRFVIQVDARLGFAHDRDQLVVDDLDQCLARATGCRLLPGPAPCRAPVDKGLDHRQRDIGFEQRHAHLAQAVAILSSVRRPCPRRFFSVRDKRSVRFSNMDLVSLQGLTIIPAPAGQVKRGY